MVELTFAILMEVFGLRIQRIVVTGGTGISKTLAVAMMVCGRQTRRSRGQDRRGPKLINALVIQMGILHHGSP